jgi:hypothetical protein
MLIDLKKIHTLWYGGFKEERKKRIEELLGRLDIPHSHVDSIYNTNGIIGCMLSNQKSIKESLSYSHPVLIMEDDCNITEWYNSTIEVPDDADAVYLGTSIRGLTADWKYKDYRSDPIWHNSPTILGDFGQVYKITNMLSTHAIMFVSKQYKEYCINLVEYRILDDLPVDIIYAEGMKKYNIYAPKKPFFYQECECPYTKHDTLMPLEEIFK